MYGFKVEEDSRFDQILEDFRSQVESLGGIGVRLQVTPMCRPSDLTKRLSQHGYEAKEETEILAWELRDSNDLVRLPEFQNPAGVNVRARNFQRAGVRNLQVQFTVIRSLLVTL